MAERAAAWGHHDHREVPFYHRDRTVQQVGRGQRLGHDPAALLQLKRGLQRGGKVVASRCHQALAGLRQMRGGIGDRGDGLERRGHGIGKRLVRPDQPPVFGGVSNQQAQHRQLCRVGLRGGDAALPTGMQSQHLVRRAGQRRPGTVGDRYRQRAGIARRFDKSHDIGRPSRLR